jgi:hypothetical protein
MAIAAVPDEEPAPTWPRVVKLRYPVDFGSDRITQLEFRRGRMGDIKGMKLGDTVPTENLLLIASRLCGKPVAALDLLDADDAGEVMDIALDFFAKCLTASKRPSRP